jgi:hypothetical protein
MAFSRAAAQARIAQISAARHDEHDGHDMTSTQMPYDAPVREAAITGSHQSRAADLPTMANMTALPLPDHLRIAVLLPCYNEEQTVAACVTDFRRVLPNARIYVFDNASTDRTAFMAQSAGATVIREPNKGKGHVVRRMFSEVDADIYIMADGDGTYHAPSAPDLVRALLRERADMVIGARARIVEDAGRKGHAFGNRIFNGLYRSMFGAQFTDIFSGYRVFTRRFVKSFPALSTGFETETEMSVHAGELALPVIEIETPYGKRPEGSASKLRSVRDGLRILDTFVRLWKETRPAQFYGAISCFAALTATGLAAPVVLTWLETGLVPRLPTAILAMGLTIIASLLAMCGMILDSVARGRIEAKRLAYLAQAPHHPSRRHTQRNDQE